MIKKSPWISVANVASCNGCDIEILTLITPKYDIERFGCILKPSARHADILLVTGAVNEQSRERLKTIFDQMSKKKKAIAIGDCAIDGCVFRKSYNIKTELDKEIPVDMYIPGCPPRPEAIMFGVIKLLGELNKNKKH